MDRAELSAALIADWGEVFVTLLGALMSADLAHMERQLQALSRVLWGRVVEAVAQARADEESARVRCMACHTAMRRVDAARPRQMQGLVGDYTLRRAYYHGASCGQGQAPLDAALGLGRGSLSPGLRRVVCRVGVEEVFAETADVVHEALGVWVSADSAERATERIGAVAEACVQGAVGRVKQGQAAWSAAEITAPPTNGVLAVEVDGVQVHRDDGWHEMKVVTVAPLGPAGTGPAPRPREWADPWGLGHGELRRRLRGGGGLLVPRLRGRLPARAGHAGRADGGRAGRWRRVDLASRRGVPGRRDTRGGRDRGQLPRLCVPLEGGARALRRGDGGGCALGRRPQGSPVRAGRGAGRGGVGGQSSAPRGGGRGRAHRPRLLLTTQAARMDYPRFVARQFPLGSGAVESTCKSLVEARATQAGLRWSRAGAQAVLSLRALQRSGGWDAFWQTHPQRRHLHLCPRARPHRRPQPSAVSPPTDARPLAVAASPASAPLPPRKPTAPQRPLLLPRSA